MRVPRLLLLGGLIGLLGLCSCGKSQEPPGRDAATLGNSAQGAPMSLPPADLGILQDQAAYKPANFAGGTPGARAGGATAATGDAGKAARDLVTNLLNDMQDGEMHLVEEAIDPEQIALLRDDDDFLFNTQQAFTALIRALEKTAGASAVEQLNADLQKLAKDKQTVDPVGADGARISPNPLLVIFGPEKAGGPMTVKKKDTGWKVELDAPLAAADMTAIRQYQEKLQASLYAIADALESKKIEGREAVFQALLKAGLGQELDLGTAATSAPATETAPTTTSAPAPSEEGGAPGPERP